MARSLCSSPSFLSRRRAPSAGYWSGMGWWWRASSGGRRRPRRTRRGCKPSSKRLFAS